MDSRYSYFLREQYHNGQWMNSGVIVTSVTLLLGVIRSGRSCWLLLATGATLGTQGVPGLCCIHVASQQVLKGRLCSGFWVVAHVTVNLV